MVTVPFFCPDTPPLKKNPVFLYTSDHFQRPNPFRPDVAVSIDDVIEPSLDALLVMESQIHEGGANGYEGLFPTDAAARQKRRDQVRKELAARYAADANRYRDALVQFYGEDRGRKIQYAWTVNGQPQGGNTPAFTFTPENVGTFTVQVTISDVTPPPPPMVT